jgi:hypothetical protein
MLALAFTSRYHWGVGRRRRGSDGGGLAHRARRELEVSATWPTGTRPTALDVCRSNGWTDWRLASMLEGMARASAARRRRPRAGPVRRGGPAGARDARGQGRPRADRVPARVDPGARARLARAVLPGDGLGRDRLGERHRRRGPPRSGVRTSCFRRVSSTPHSTFSAASISPMCRSNIAPDRIIATGSATPLPAMSGALPGRPRTPRTPTRCSRRGSIRGHRRARAQIEMMSP